MRAVGTQKRRHLAPLRDLEPQHTRIELNRALEILDGQLDAADLGTAIDGLGHFQ
jgi:hypothetical protein